MAVSPLFSGRANAYYKLILKTKRLPKDGLKARKMQKLVVEAQGDIVSSALLSSAVPCRVPTLLWLRQSPSLQTTRSLATLLKPRSPSASPARDSNRCQSGYHFCW